MNIFILRHGIAAEPGAPGIKTDAERPLIAKGEQRLRAAAAAMEKMGLSFDVIVGHEPQLSRLIALLATGDTVAAIDMKKGGLCKLETEDLEYGHCATLAWLLTPRQMELMA